MICAHKIGVIKISPKSHNNLHLLSKSAQKCDKTQKIVKKRGNFAEKAKTCSGPKFGKLCVRRANAKFHRV